MALYFNKRLMFILLLGFVSGLPLALTGSTLAVWLTESGVNMKTIGLFALIGMPYSLKFLWAPLVDQLHIPLLTDKFGQRRAWVMLSGIATLITIFLLGGVNPVTSPWLAAFFAFLIAVASATQDIVIDAYRVEYLEPSEQGAGATMTQIGYRLGMLLSSAGALVLSEFTGWFFTYMVMACCIPVGILVVCFAGEPLQHQPPRAASLAEWMKRAVVEPFAEFMRREGWILTLCFIILYKLGDAFAGNMTTPFLVKLGFSKLEIAGIVKTFGLGATFAGLFIGGWLVLKLPLRKCLLFCGILQMLSNLVFVAQAYIGKSNEFLMLTITIENLAGGMGAAAFVAFLSQLCNVRFTATQYALFSALATLGRTTVSASSGYIVEASNWVVFFSFSTIIALPALVLLYWVKMPRLPAG